MSTPPLPSAPVRSVGLHPSDSSSLWTRLATYASENKAVVYTIGAVVVVAGAGGIYYLSQSESGKGGKSKKDRRKDIKDKASSKDKKVSEGETSQLHFSSSWRLFFPIILLGFYRW